MRFGTRILSTLGAMAMITTTLAAGGTAFAQSDSHSTTLTVENTACVDDPTSIVIDKDRAQLQARDPQNPAHSIRQFGTNGSGYLLIDMDVNECLGTGWTMVASITDFTSGSNSISSADHFKIKGYSYNAGNVSPAGSTGGQVPGTTGIPWGSNTNFTTTSPGVASTTLSTGTAASVGGMWQAFHPLLTNLPNNIPGGDYEATLTVTWTPNAP